MTTDGLPIAVKRESRIAFALYWYADKATANRAAEWIAKNQTQRGAPLGRAPEFDFTEAGSPHGGQPGRRLYAVKGR